MVTHTGGRGDLRSPAVSLRCRERIICLHVRCHYHKIQIDGLRWFRGVKVYGKTYGLREKKGPLLVRSAMLVWSVEIVSRRLAQRRYAQHVGDAGETVQSVESRTVQLGWVSKH